MFAGNLQYNVGSVNLLRIKQNFTKGFKMQKCKNAKREKGKKGKRQKSKNARMLKGKKAKKQICKTSKLQNCKKGKMQQIVVYIRCRDLQQFFTITKVKEANMTTVKICLIVLIAIAGVSIFEFFYFCSN